MSSIQKHWPDFLLEIVDFVELAQVENQELALLQNAKNQLFDDQFVLTSSMAAVKRREQMLGIQADPTTETLDFRKKRIINRYSTNPPFTIKYLQERLNFLVGEGRAIAAVDLESYILTVTAALYDAGVFKEVERTISALKPANLIYQQQTALEDTVKLEEHIKVHPIKRLTHLGTTWRLGVTPFAELEPEVNVK